MKRLFFLITVTFIVCHCNAQTHPTEEGRVLTVLSADGKVAATVVTITGAKVKLWDVNTGKMIKHLYTSMDATHIRLNDDGSKLLIYDVYNKYSLMRDVDTGEEMEPVNDVWLNGRFASDNIRIAKTTISNSMLEILHPTDDSKSWRYNIKSKEKIYAIYLKESNTFIYAVKDKLYKKEGDTEDKPVLIGNFGRMENVSSDLKYGEYRSKIFSLESGEILWEPSSGSYQQEFNSEAGTLVLIKDDGLVSFHEPQTGQLTKSYNLNTKIYTSNVSLSWEGGLLAYPKNETDVKIVNLYTGEEVMALDESQEYARKVNEGMALVAARDKELLQMSADIKVAKTANTSQYCYCAILKMQAFGRTDIHAVFVDIEKGNGTEEEIKLFGKNKVKERAAKNYFIDQEQLEKEKTCEKMKQEIGTIVTWSDFKILRFNNMDE